MAKHNAEMIIEGNNAGKGIEQSHGAAQLATTDKLLKEFHDAPGAERRGVVQQPLEGYILAPNPFGKSDKSLTESVANAGSGLGSDKKNP
jgi:hypothetical protein